MKKTIISILLIILMAFVLSGCDKVMIGATFVMLQEFMVTGDAHSIVDLLLTYPAYITGTTLNNSDTALTYFLNHFNQRNYTNFNVQNASPLVEGNNATVTANVSYTYTSNGTSYSDSRSATFILKLEDFVMWKIQNWYYN